MTLEFSQSTAPEEVYLLKWLEQKKKLFIIVIIIIAFFQLLSLPFPIITGSVTEHCPKLEKIHLKN